MFASSPIAGIIGAGIPFVRFGRGGQRLVVLPGINDAFFPVVASPLYTAWFFRRYGDRFTVYAMSRKRRLPLGYATEDMARDYASAIEEIGGPVHVLGLSMGSFIAQDLAIGFPGLVRRLVLALAGASGSPETIGRIDRWIGFSRQGSWKELYVDMIDATFRGWRRIVWRKIVSVFSFPPSIPSDFIVSAEASKRHDARARLRGVAAPVLVVGGAKDKLFPADLFVELSELVPGATLRLMKRSGHGVFIERKKAFDNFALEFLGGGRAA